MLRRRRVVPLVCGAAFVAVHSSAVAQFCAYVTSGNAVSVIDTSTNTVAATIPVGVSPVGVAVTPNGRSVYVANCGASCLEGAPSADSVSVIDTATNAVATTVQVGMGPFLLAVTPDGQAVYVANCGTSCLKGGVHTGNSVSVIATATNKVTATIPGVGPGAIAITPRDTFGGGIFAYVANWMSDTVSVINTEDNEHTTITNALNLSGGIAITPDGAFVYVPSSQDGTIAVIDTATSALTTIPSGGGAAGGIAIASVPGGCSRAHCVGDCGGDAAVTVDELLTMVNIALGNADAGSCTAGNANHDGQITIDEILAAVNHALNGC